MKSRTKPALRVVPAAQVQLSLNVQGVLRDVQRKRATDTLLTRLPDQMSST